MARFCSPSASRRVCSAHDVVTYSSATLPAQHLASALVGAGFEVTRFRPVERMLLDTFDGRLHAAGVRLEVRKGAEMQLIVSDGGPAPAVTVVASVPSVGEDLPSGPLRARLVPLLDVRALRPTVSVSGLHATAVRRNESGKVIVTVDLYDQLAAAPGEMLALRWAAEVGPFEGYAKAARQADDLFGSLGLTTHDGDVLDLAAQELAIDLGGHVDSPTVALDPSEPAAGGFRRVLANLADTIDAHRQGTVDAVDPEFLHDLRVAVRRTRSVLSHAKRVLPADGRDHFKAEFRWLGAVTSPLRDMDVYVIEWPGYVAALDPATAEALRPVVDHIERRRAAEHAILAGHLGSPRYQGLMTAWRAWLDGPATEKESSKRKEKSAPALGPIVASRIAEAQEQLLSRGRGIGPDTAAEELHELRKDAKRLRYLLECFGGLLPASARKPFVQRLKAVQDNLGEHQDTEVHTSQLKAMSEELHGAPGITADTLLAMGRLTEVFDRRRQEAREQFAGRFAAYDTKPTARALAELLRGLS